MLKRAKPTTSLIKSELNPCKSDADGKRNFVSYSPDERRQNMLFVVTPKLYL